MSLAGTSLSSMAIRQQLQKSCMYDLISSGAMPSCTCTQRSKPNCIQAANQVHARVCMCTPGQPQGDRRAAAAGTYRQGHEQLVQVGEQALRPLKKAGHLLRACAQWGGAWGAALEVDHAAAASTAMQRHRPAIGEAESNWWLCRNVRTLSLTLSRLIPGCRAASVVAAACCTATTPACSACMAFNGHILEHDRCAGRPRAAESYCTLRI